MCAWGLHCTYLVEGRCGDVVRGPFVKHRVDGDYLGCAHGAHMERTQPVNSEQQARGSGLDEVR